MLFRREDFAEPKGSRTFKRMDRILSGPDRSCLQALRKWCTDPFTRVPKEIETLFGPAGSRVPGIQALSETFLADIPSGRVDDDGMIPAEILQKLQVWLRKQEWLKQGLDGDGEYEGLVTLMSPDSGRDRTYLQMSMYSAEKTIPDPVFHSSSTELQGLLQSRFGVLSAGSGYAALKKLHPGPHALSFEMHGGIKYYIAPQSRQHWPIRN